MSFLIFFTLHPILLLISTGIFGAIIGSFLNVVIYRYPIILLKEWSDECRIHLNLSAPSPTQPFNLALPRSHCPHCKHCLSTWHNIPMLSYIFLRGKCAYCRQVISCRYFITEFLSAVLSILVVMHVGLSWHTFSILMLTYGLLALSFIDYDHQFLPDAITYSLLWLGLCMSTLHIGITPSSAIVGALIGYLFLYAIAKCYFFCQKKDGMGLGDCKMLAMIGAWVGAFSLLDVMLISAILALIVSGILLIGKKIQKDKPIPFGPYLGIAGWLVVMYGSTLSQWIFQWS